MRPVLGYWNVRGIAEPIRYLLRLVGADYEDRRYVLTPDKGNWKAVKDTLGLNFPNLPFYTDGNVKLTQTLCILRYLGRKHGMAGNTEEETRTLDMLEQTAVDLMLNLHKISSRPDFEQMVDAYLDALQERLGGLSKFLGAKNYLLGNRLTYVDLYLLEAIGHNRCLKESCLDGYSNLRSYTERIQTLPNLDKYLNSDEFRVWPLYGPHSKFGGVHGTYPFFK